MSNPNTTIEPVKAVQTTFHILKTIKEIEKTRITDIARETGISKSTVYRHLKTLEREGYLTKVDDEYRIGMPFLYLGDYARRQKKGHTMAREKVNELAEATGERVQYMIEEQGFVYYVYRHTGEQAVHLHRHLGERIPVHRTAAGKAILAEYSDERIREICDCTDFQGGTENSITSCEELYEAVETIRKRGYSYNIGENSEGIRAVGVAVNGSDRVLGGLSIAGPAHRLKGEVFKEELPDLLLGRANELELNIKYS